MQLWAHLFDGTADLIQATCRDPNAPGAAPVVTPGLVLRELRTLGLPASAVHTNPADKTLVNLDTIFYTEPTRVSRRLVILGQAVDVEATPTTYQWRFDDDDSDDESDTTHSPGKPYPSLEITHRYLHANVTVHPSVNTTYSARFRVGGGIWQDVDGTVTTTGPSSNLRVVEATPVLSGER